MTNGAKLMKLGLLLGLFTLALVAGGCGQPAPELETDGLPAKGVYARAKTPAPTPSPRPRFTTCSGREEEPPCGPGAEVGRPYPYTLYTHCGVRAAVFDGRRWIADPILTDSGNPPEIGLLLKAQVGRR